MSSTFSNLKFELIGNGEQSGTWGTTTNTNIGTAIEQAIVGMATLDSGDFSTNVCTLTLSNTNAAQDARALCLNIASGAVSAAGTVNVPAIEKPYIIINGSSFTVTVKVSGQTGVAVPAGKRTVVYNNGTDVGSQINWLSALDAATVTLSGNLTLNGGTANGVAYLNGSKVLTTGSALTFDGTNLTLGANKVIVKNAVGDAQGLQIYQAASDLSSIFNYYNGSMAFGVNNVEQMRLTSTGLGIGTSSPSSKLTVASTGSTIELKQNFTGSATYYVMDNTVESGGKRWRFGYTGAAGIPLFSLFNQTDNVLAWAADASGNLGLGVTPSAWGGSNKAIDIGTVGGIAADSASMRVLNNAYSDSGGTFRYKTTAAAFNYVQNPSLGHVFFTAPSGTAGNAITFTQAMTLDASGNLLVGGTSALANGKLQVTGSIGLTGNTQIRQSTNSDGNTLQLFATQVVVGSTNATSYGYAGGGLLASLSSAASAISLDVGGTTAGHRLQVVNDGSGSTGTLNYSNAGTSRFLVNSSTGVVTMGAYGAGAATFSAAGVISSVSDETWKTKDGAPVDPDSMLKKLEPGYWYYNDEKKETFGADRQLGFYAQNVNAAIGPEAAPEPEEGKPWGYYDRSVLAVAVMSLQKALATIESLEARIATLESKP